MKTDDIFEALTDIDDKFIAAAHPADTGDDPVVVYPAPRKPVWKTLVPVAACLAVLCTAGAFGVRYFKTRPEAENSNTSVSESVSYDKNGAPENSEQYVTDFVEIEVGLSNVERGFALEEFPYYSFTATYSDVLLNGYNMESVISADQMMNLFLCDLNGDGKREFCATVRNDGVRSVEILDFANNCRYTSGKKWEETYLQVDYKEDVKTLMMYERSGGGDCWLVGSGALTLDIMTCVFSDTSAVKINDAKTFEMAEFPDLYFEKQYAYIVMGEYGSDTLKTAVISGSEFFLADINGDGKREICSCIGFGEDEAYDIVTVYDIANDEKYSVDSKLRENLIRLELKDGVLYLVTSEYDHGEAKEISREPLTISMLQKEEKPDHTQVPLFFKQTFTLPDLEGFRFTVDTTANTTGRPRFRFGWEDKIVDNYPYQVYLCDFDGDGKREIAINSPDNGGCIKVYGFMEHGEFGEAVYSKKGGCQLTESNGTLVVYGTRDGEQKPFGFSKSDLSPKFLQTFYYEITDMDFTLDLTDIMPWSGKYTFQVSGKCLSVFGGDEFVNSAPTTFNGMYVILNRENGTLYFVCTHEETKEFSVVTVTEDSVKLSRADLRYTMDSNTGETYCELVDEDGNVIPLTVDSIQ